MTAERVIPVEIVRTKRPARQWIVMLLSSFVSVFGAAAVVMLLIGACHHEIDPRIPAFSYLQTLLSVYTLRTIVSAVTPWDTYKLWSREAAK